MTDWTLAHVMQDKPNGFAGPVWPHEVMVKLFSSRSHSQISAKFADTRRADVLEVGCMYANNLRYFHSLGHRCTGVEVTQDMVDLARQRLNHFALEGIPVQLGSNRSLPFADDSFDLLVSVNTIHYDSGDDVVAGLREFRRVLRTGGIAFVETAGGQHFIRNGADRLATLRFRPRFGDFRDGGVYGLFDDLDHFGETLKSVFAEVEMGRALEQFPERTLEFYFGLGLKA
jgi:SAM-dependent methyltransferase